ncbi:MAG: PIN domain-containing protein [Magnetococcales bacterium]|nr:PIN domain-containing protein [Magnetococcales bacterium]MBF0165692.1 PIN domain-containing protein [Magnetococcales bacterium]
MSDRAFVDTNVWVYAHLDQDGDAKGSTATTLVENIPSCVISTQVLNEYYAVMLKNHAAEAWIRRNLENMIRHCEVQIISLAVIRATYAIRDAYGFSYWDSLMVASALQAQCAVLYSEDLQHGQRIDGRLRIVNPFLEQAG